VIPLTGDNLLPWVALIVVAVLGVGRLSRLITYDDYPPTIAIRARWAAITHDGGWSKLASCFWCLTPWLMLVAGVWFWLGYGTWAEAAWWVFFGWLAISYLTSMVVARDEPAE
jgi:uncharacterized iron-regulated membrane protein